MEDYQPPSDLVMDVDGRDGARIPMQWDATGRGFTTGVPWLPFCPGQCEVNVAQQLESADSLLALYRLLISCRNNSAALRRGSYRSLDAPDHTFVYERSVPGERLLIALNFSAQATAVTVGDLPECGQLKISTLSGQASRAVSLRPLRLAPDEGVIVRCEDRS